MRMYQRSGQEIKTDCPKCNGKNKLYINPVKRLFVCFKCYFKGRVTKELFDFVDDHRVDRKQEITQLPEKVIPVHSSPTALKYLKTRNIEPRADWLFCYEGLYNNRVIFPIYCFGKYWGFQARTVLDSKMESIRYRTSPGLPTSKILYNYDNLPREISKAVFLCEGVFGATMFENVVSSFTKRLSPTQAQVLAAKASTVIVAYDKDATKEAIETGYLLYSFGVDVHIMMMSKKGPDDHTKEELEALPVVKLFDVTASLTGGYKHGG